MVFTRELQKLKSIWGYFGYFGLKIGLPDSHDDVFALALFKVAQAWVSTYQYCFEFETRNSVEELPT